MPLGVSLRVASATLLFLAKANRRRTSLSNFNPQGLRLSLSLLRLILRIYFLFLNA